MDGNTQHGRGAGKLASTLDETAGWSSRRISRAITAFVALGIVLRIIRYLLNFPFWCDESMLAANFIDRGYVDMLRPLDYRQVGPILFLWIELTAVRCLGFSEFALRLFPVVCAVASVPLFRHVAGRLLEPKAELLAVAIFAVSGWPIRFGAEVKPYASDLLVALGFLAMAVEWWRRPGRVEWLWALAASAPLAMALSFTAVFAAGGVSLGLLGVVWRARRKDAWIAFAAFNASVATTFLTLLAFYAPSAENRDYFQMFWASAFPPLDSLGGLVLWFLKVHTGSIFAYPEGGERLASLGTSLLVASAIVALWRRGSWTVLALCLAPFGLGLIASALKRYPYGQSVRTMQYLAPAVCILAGVGASTIAARFRRPELRHRVASGLLVALATLGTLRMGIDLAAPYPSATDDRARDFARWFWIEMGRNAEVADFKTDLGKVFSPRHWNGDMTDMYLSQMKIYSPRHHRGEPLRLDAVSESRPLRCVLFNEIPREVPGFDAWLQEMLTRYDLRKVDRYPVSAVNPKRLVYWDNVYFVYEFVPKPAPPIAGAVVPGPSRR